MAGPYLAFTIKNLVGKTVRDFGLLDILNAFTPEKGDSSSKVSIGWLMRLEIENDPNGKLLPKVGLPKTIDHLVLHGRVISDTSISRGGLELKFEVVSAGKTTDGVDLINTLFFNKLIIESQIPDPGRTNSEHFNTVKTADKTNTEFEFADHHTKVVYFSRTQLLLAREFLTLGRDSNENKILLFSGCQYAIGRMGSRRNMTELSTLEQQGNPDVAHWFSLKAEVLSKAELNTSDQSLSLTFLEEYLKNPILFDPKWFYPDFPIRLPRTPRIPTPRLYGNTSTYRDSMAEENAAAKAPYLYFGRPCPPGWYPSDEGFTDLVDFVRWKAQGAGRELEPYQIQLHDFLKETFNLVEAGGLPNLPPLTLYFEPTTTTTTTYPTGSIVGGS